MSYVETIFIGIGGLLTAGILLPCVVLAVHDWWVSR
jgi:hypothetical protein